MLKLFQSLFGDRRVADSQYPAALVDAVIERAVDGTDPRLRALGDYRRRLRTPAIATIGHVIELVEGLPAPLSADAQSYRNDPLLCSMFASFERLLDVLGRDASVDAARRSHPGSRLFGLLFAQMSEKHVFGLDLENDLLRRDVQQTVISFDAHRVVDAHPDEAECRRALRMRAFDHLLAQVLEAMSERSDARRDLGQQRVLLKRKLAAQNAAGLSFGATFGAETGDAARLEQKLADIERELAQLGPDTLTLKANLDLLADALARPATRLWLESRRLLLDQRNVLREASVEGARAIGLDELHDGRGARAVLRLLVFDPAGLPSSDFFSATRHIR